MYIAKKNKIIIITVIFIILQKKNTLKNYGIVYHDVHIKLFEIIKSNFKKLE